MIGIKVNNELIDIPSGLSFSFLIKNSAFFLDGVEGNTSYPITIPLTEQNRRIFSNSHIPGSKTAAESYNVQVFDNDIPVIVGKLKIKNRYNTSIKAVINSDISSLFTDFQTPLKDVDFGGNLFFTHNPHTTGYYGFDDYVTGMNQQALFDSPATPYAPAFPYAVFPVKNEGAYSDLLDLGYPQWRIDQYQGYMNPYSTKGFLWGGTNFDFTFAFDNNLMSASPFLVEALKRIAAWLGVSLSGDFVNDPYIIRIVLLSLNAQYHNVRDLSKSWSPGSTVADLFNFIVRKFNLQLTLDNGAGQLQINYNKLYEFSSVDDWTKIASPYFESISNEESINIADVIDGGDSATKEEYVDDNYSSGSVESFSDLPSTPGEFIVKNIVLVKDEMMYYQFQFSGSTYSWVEYGPAQENDPDGSKTINTNCSIVASKNNTMKQWINNTNQVEAFDYPLYCPVINQKMNNKHAFDSDGKLQVGNQFSFKPLYYHGLVANSYGKLYPQASALRHTVGTPTVVHSTFNLNSEGDLGTFNKFWKDFLEHIAIGDTYTFKVMLKPIDIINIDINKPKLIDGQLYFIKKITTNFPIKALSTVEMVRYVP
jgi:hypothetical protein